MSDRTRKLVALLPVLIDIYTEYQGRQQVKYSMAWTIVFLGFLSSKSVRYPEYLAAGVVPSTLNIRTGARPDEIATVAASPLVLLNSGMEFYLNRIDDLMRSYSRRG